MIEVTETLRWALIIFGFSTGGDGREVITSSAPTYYQSYDACRQEAQRLLGVIAIPEGVRIEASCVPRDIVRP